MTMTPSDPYDRPGDLLATSGSFVEDVWSICNRLQKHVLLASHRNDKELKLTLPWDPGRLHVRKRLEKVRRTLLEVVHGV